jgi:glycosyltransferase involved in cell wall biosynthesis
VEPLRVALIIGSLEVGGAETQLVGTARRLKALGVQVEVILLAGYGPLLPLLEADGIPVHCLHYPGIRFRDAQRRLRPWLALLDALRVLGSARLMRSRRYDVVHAYLYHSYAMLVPLAWLARVPVRIAARRGMNAAQPDSALVRLGTRVSTRLSAAVVANAEAVAMDAHVVEHVPRRKLHVIPNAIDLPDTTARPEVEPPEAIIIANLIHYKGHLDLVAALRTLDDPPTVRCIGEGPMRPQIEAAIAEAGLQDVIRLEGRTVGARALYAQAQFALLTSHTEGMPNAVLEAMAYGLPVVATDVGGCRELVEDGITGLLVPARDPQALAAAIKRMASDPQLRVAAGRAARERAAAYSWEVAAQRHLDLYGALLERTPRRRE